MAVLTCEATGDPKHSITWSKDGNTSIPRAQFRNDDHILSSKRSHLVTEAFMNAELQTFLGNATAVVIAGKYH